MTPMQRCYEVVSQWTATAYRHHCYRMMFAESKRPNWNKMIPSMASAVRMRMVLTRMQEFITDEMLMRATIWLTNDMNAGCLLIVQADGGQRVIAKVLEDSTLEMRYYRNGRFQYGIVLWPDGHQTDFLEEPLEVL